MRKSKVIVFLIVLISLFVSLPVFADSESTTPEPYNKEEFPQALKDLRRFEIVTLGSMPFVMLDCNMVYSGILYAQGKTQTFNPLNTSNYSTKQQLGLILTSLSISCAIGLTDFAVNKIKSGKIEKTKKSSKNNSVLIVPIEEDPDAIKIEAPEEIDDFLEDVE